MLFTAIFGMAKLEVDRPCTSVSARASMNLITYVKYNIPVCDTENQDFGNRAPPYRDIIGRHNINIKKIGGRRRDETVTYVPVGGRDQICGVKVSLAKWKIR